MVKCTGLENRHTLTGIGGSNPSLSAIQSEVQRNPPGLLGKLQETSALSRFDPGVLADAGDL